MPIYGIIVSVIFLYFEWDVPGYLENTTFLLTYATIFLVLMSLGIALSRLKVVSWTHASILGSCEGHRRASNRRLVLLSSLI